MNSSNFKRMLWKEYREGWPVISAYFILPGILFPICSHFPKSDLASAFVFAIMFAMPFVAVMWGSEKKRTIKQNKDILEAVLPVTPLQEWICTFLIPAVAVGLCGGWLNALLPYSTFLEKNHHTVITSMIIVAMAYLISSFLSKFLSSFLGIMVGTIWVIATLEPISEISPGVQIYAIGFISIAVASLLSFEFRKMGQVHKKSFAWIVLILFTLFINYRLINKLYNGVMHPVNETGGITNAVIDNNSGIFVLRYPGNNGMDRITYDDRLCQIWINGKPKGREFKSPSVSIPIAIDNNRQVYILTKKPGSREISLNRWKPASDKIEQMYKLKDVRGIDIKLMTSQNIVSEVPQLGWINPACDKLLLRIPSMLNDGQKYDLRIIDLSSGKNKLLLVNEPFAWNKCTWTKDKAYLTGNLPPYEIDLDHYKAKNIQPKECYVR